MALAYKQAYTAEMYEQTTGQYSGNLNLNGTPSYVAVWGNTGGTLITRPDGTTVAFNVFTPSGVAITGGTMSGVAITTGSINNTPIGATTRNTAAISGLNMNSTDSSGTPGNVTNNSPMGRAAFAAAGTAVTVTNSNVVATSIVQVQVMGSDATLTTARVTSVNAGNFVVTGNAAATAATTFNFVVINI